MFKLIRDLISPQRPVKLSHPIFGDLELRQGKKGPYWLHEACEDEALTVAIDAVGEAPPTKSQEQFFKEITRRLDDTYRLVASQLESRHLSMNREPVKGDWRETFRLASLDVPLDGNRQLPWEITFECLTNNSGFLYTCRFELGEPVHVSVDT